MDFKSYLSLRAKAPSLSELKRKQELQRSTYISAVDTYEDDSDLETSLYKTNTTRTTNNFSLDSTAQSTKLKTSKNSNFSISMRPLTKTFEEFTDVRKITPVETVTCDSRYAEGFNLEGGVDDSDGINGTCAVCFSDRYVLDNKFLKCKGPCGEKVHHECYGTNPRGQTGHFKCDGCQESSGTRNVPSCALCYTRGGLMKRSTCGRLVHQMCVLFCPELVVDASMSAKNLECIDPDRSELICRFCSKIGGGIVQCKFGKCRASFHPMCALKANLFLAIRAVSLEEDDLTTIDISKGTDEGASCFEYEVYCQTHEQYCCMDGIVAHSREPLIIDDSTNSEKYKSDHLEFETPLEMLASNTQHVLVDSVEKPTQLSSANRRPLALKRLRKLTEDNFAHLNSSTSHNWKANSNRGEVQVNKLRPIDRNARIGRKANIPVDIDRYFDNEAALSGSDSGDESEGEIGDSQSEKLSGDFINDGAYTQASDGDYTQGALHFRVNQAIDEDSPGYERLFRGAERCANKLRMLVKGEQGYSEGSSKEYIGSIGASSADDSMDDNVYAKEWMQDTNTQNSEFVNDDNKCSNNDDDDNKICDECCNEDNEDDGESLPRNDSTYWTPPFELSASTVGDDENSENENNRDDTDWEVTILNPPKKRHKSIDACTATQMKIAQPPPTSTIVNVDSPGSMMPLSHWYDARDEDW